MVPALDSAPIEATFAKERWGLLPSADRLLSVGDDPFVAITDRSGATRRWVVPGATWLEHIVPAPSGGVYVGGAGHQVWHLGPDGKVVDTLKTLGSVYDLLAYGQGVLVGTGGEVVGPVQPTPCSTESVTEKYAVDAVTWRALAVGQADAPAGGAEAAGNLWDRDRKPFCEHMRTAFGELTEDEQKLLRAQWAREVMEDGPTVAETLGWTGKQVMDTYRSAMASMKSAAKPYQRPRRSRR